MTVPSDRLAGLAAQIAELIAIAADEEGLGTAANEASTEDWYWAFEQALDSGLEAARDREDSRGS